MLGAITLSAQQANNSHQPFHFIAHGDTGYNAREKAAYQKLITLINQDKPAFSIHVGDIWGAENATDFAYKTMLANFNRYNQPLIYTPGDNEWADTWQKKRGSHKPLERLNSLRKIYFPNNNSLGKSPIPLARQAALPENAHWQHNGVPFYTVHTVPPSQPKLKQKPHTIEEFNKRTALNIAWVKQAFTKATAAKSPAIVFAWHPWMFGKDGQPTPACKTFMDAFLQAAKTYPGKVLIIHGDYHAYIVDQPFPGHPNITRLEVYGSPFTAAVKVGVDASKDQPFSFSSIPGVKK